MHTFKKRWLKYFFIFFGTLCIRNTSYVTSCRVFYWCVLSPFYANQKLRYCNICRTFTQPTKFICCICFRFFFFVKGVKSLGRLCPNFYGYIRFEVTLSEKKKKKNGFWNYKCLGFVTDLRVQIWMWCIPVVYILPSSLRAVKPTFGISYVLT